MPDDPPITIHSNPSRDREPWSDPISLTTLGALVDRMNPGCQLDFTCRGVECRVLTLRPQIARFWRAGGGGLRDFRGDALRSRGARLVAHLRDSDVAEMRDLQLVSVDLIPADQVVIPSARFQVRRTRCSRCGGSGRDVLFMVPRDCEPCEGTGWTSSSENDTETEAREVRPPGSEKGSS